MLKSEKGFSLVELLIVIALVAIVATIALWGSQSVKGHRLTAASKQLYGDLQKIRVDAMTKSPSGATSRGFGIRFTSNSAYTAFEFNDTNGDFTYAGTGEEANTKDIVLTNGITVTLQDATSTPTGTNNVLIFNKQGLAKNYQWSQGNRTYVIQLSGVSQIRCVTLDDVRIREGVWNAASNPQCTIQ